MSNDFPDHREFLEFSEKLANLSRNILLKAAQEPHKVEIKSDNSFVTETDKKVEQQLRELIQKTYPNHGILGEEFKSFGLDADFVWVLDPIDGTAAFLAGIPVYGTLIGLAYKGRPFIGVIDHPATKDRWKGVSNRITYHNNQTVKVRSCKLLSSAFVTCSNSDFMNDKELIKFERIKQKTQYVQYGGSCFSYGVLASGKTDIAIDSGLDAFDIFAPAAVILGAGGFISDWEGKEITFNVDNGVIAAGDRARMDDILKLLQ